MFVFSYNEHIVEGSKLAWRGRYNAAVSLTVITESGLVGGDTGLLYLLSQDISTVAHAFYDDQHVTLCLIVSGLSRLWSEKVIVYM